jgi:hypothetical protein
MKKLGIFVLAAIMVLSFTMAAQATQTINTAATGEVDLWTIVNGWTGLSLTQADLEGAVVLETIDAGPYALVNYAKYAGFTETITVPSGDLVSLADGNVDTSTYVAFSEGAPFGFSDNYTGSENGTKTTQNQNAPDQSSGFIFDLGQFEAALAGQYVVAFEDGNGNQPYNDKDYNDMVGLIRPVPVPPSVLLMGSGLLGLGLVGWRRRFFS